MFQIAGSGDRLNIGVAPYIRPTVGHAAHLVYDSFTDTDGVHLHDHTPEISPGAWTEYSGVNQFTISSNETVSGGAGGAGIAIDAVAANVDMQATLRPLAEGENNPGIFYRGSDITNFILDFLHTAGDAIYIYKQVAGNWTSIATKAYTIGTTALVVRGTVNAADGHEMYIDGVSQLTVTDAANNTLTAIGFYSQAGQSGWDTLTVTW